MFMLFTRLQPFLLVLFAIVLKIAAFALIRLPWVSTQRFKKIIFEFGFSQN